MIRPFLSSLVLAGCAALGGAAEPAPDGPVYATADQRPFWYATILDWTFTVDAYSHNPLPPSIMPKRLVEVALWRGQVTDSPTGPRWSGENWLTWTRSAQPVLFEHNGAMTVQLERAKVGLTFPQAIGACPCGPGSGDVLLDLTSGAPVNYRMREDDDFSVILVGLGIPDLALGRRPGPGIVRQALPGSTAGWTWNDPQVVRTVGPLDLGKVNIGGIQLDVAMQVKVSGTANGGLAWDAAAGRPLSSTVVADVGVTVMAALTKPLPKEAAVPEIRGRLAIRRHCWMLPDSTDLEVPRDLPKLLTALAAQALVDGKPTPWADLARSPDVDLAAVAAGVVQAAAHPPTVTSAKAGSAP
jgi:hypothetical protein